MRDVLDEVGKKVGAEMSGVNVVDRDGNVCDLNRSVKETVAACGGSISFVLSDK